MEKHKYTIDSEKTSHNKHSPGVVQNSEILLRLLYAPEHIKDGKVINSAIPIIELSERGLSFDRLKYAIKSLIEERIDKQKTKSPNNRKSSYLAKLESQSIRDFKNEEIKREFLIIDDATIENIAHASIYAINNSGKAALRRARSKLIHIFQDYFLIDDLL